MTDGKKDFGFLCGKLLRVQVEHELALKEEWLEVVGVGTVKCVWGMDPCLLCQRDG